MNSEDKICESDFEKIKLIGKGGFSHVWMVRHDVSGIICAMKIISK